MSCYVIWNFAQNKEGAKQFLADLVNDFHTAFLYDQKVSARVAFAEHYLAGVVSADGDPCGGGSKLRIRKLVEQRHTP